MSRLGSYVLAGLLLACGSEPLPVIEGAGGSSSTGTTAATTSGGSVPLVYHVSFVAETEPGHAPSLFRLANDTVDEKLSITLPDGEPFAFYAVDWLTTTDYVPAALSDPLEEVIVSLHTNENLCLRFYLDEIVGAQALEPLGAYTLHVTSPEIDLEAELAAETPPEPFLGLRARVDDPKAFGKAAKTTLAVTVSGEDLVFERIFFPDQAVRYELLPAIPPVVETLRYTDLEGIVHSLPAPVSLGAAPGYTVVIALEPIDGAAASLELVAGP